MGYGFGIIWVEWNASNPFADRKEPWKFAWTVEGLYPCAGFPLRFSF